MKKLFWMLALVLTVQTVMANGTESEEDATANAKVVALSNGVYKLYYVDQIPQGKVVVTILDQVGELVQKDVIRNESAFVRPYNFSKQPAGNYTMVVDNGQKSFSTTLTFGVVNAAQDLKVAVEEAGDNRFKLVVKEANMTPVSVSLTNVEGEVIFTELISRQANFSKVYNLNRILKGQQVTLKVTNGTVNIEKVLN